MTNIKRALWAIPALLTALWLAANLPFPEEVSFITIRNLLVQYSGTLAIGAMSVAMILATRARWLEPWLNGLDKSYRLHKWLGIFALVASPIHWVAANGPKWAVQWGLMTPPERKGAPADMPDLPFLQTFFNSQRGTAEMIGEWAFYAAVILIALALIKRFPYKLFVSTHTLIAVAYLALALHAVVLMDYSAWTQPLGFLMALLIAGGVISAGLALSRRIGRSKQVGGQIETIRHFPEMGITETQIALEPGWTGHEAGQFAFVTFDKREGKHPFTIASAWDPNTRGISFITKGLGDYTDFLSETLKPGDAATVEGPYGRFTFEDGSDRQIWIGGGIGITPFIARMKQLARKGGTTSVDLIHSTRELSGDALDLLQADAVAAGIKLHVLRDDRDGFLTGARLKEMVPDWQAASVWFCGPAAFGQVLRDDLVTSGLAAGSFHQELFNMR
ncbi:ferric reductase-like transmembrane domain-containing protein [Tropicimonas sp. TH_r6]|uniref:ferredoxin reductase family protein n=1 Tax=Tropicimonas sp. TH_r6 TaxID=3082085 RepID=UPI002954E564|nr:ferric reductase-like transmembrane domain-containing protein [Tropicimonas sp. TH_r6]MDV7145448.1 ferric reductase-like transmembrane domain-containing protein [Tropicimonas sp. TH_r6]